MFINAKDKVKDSIQPFQLMSRLKKSGNVLITKDPITFRILLQSISTVHLKWPWRLKVANIKTQMMNGVNWERPLPKEFL